MDILGNATRAFNLFSPIVFNEKCSAENDKAC